MDEAGSVQCWKYGVESNNERFGVAKAIGDEIGWLSMNCTAISVEVSER